MSFRVNVDPANPGQFFACCGLLELATRWKGQARARFGEGDFEVEADCTLGGLLGALVSSPRSRMDPTDEMASPIWIGEPFGLLLDWWKDEETGGKELKLWAGQMRSDRIEGAMIAQLADPAVQTDGLLDVGRVVHDPEEPSKKVEPFYFDARRAPNAHSRDVGFSPNKLELTTTAFPAVEGLCLIGLQRFRPAPTAVRRVYDYATWPVPLSAVAATPVANHAVQVSGARTYRFECWFRTGQKKNKAFRPAVRIS
jgi:CRISPR-associated protein Csb3